MQFRLATRKPELASERVRDVAEKNIDLVRKILYDPKDPLNIKDELLFFEHFYLYMHAYSRLFDALQTGGIAGSLDDLDLSAVETEELRETLDLCEGGIDGLGDLDQSNDQTTRTFIQSILSGRTMLRVREALVARDLNKAVVIIEQWRKDPRSSLCPLIDDFEIIMRSVTYKCLVEKCTVALSVGLGGMLDGKEMLQLNMSQNLFQEAYQYGVKYGAANEKAVQLHNSVRLVLALRNAQIEGNIDSMEKVIVEALQLSSSITPETRNEFEYASRHLYNEKMMIALKSAVLSGRIEGEPGRLLLENLKVEDLEDTIGAVVVDSSTPSNLKFLLDSVKSMAKIRGGFKANDMASVHQGLRFWADNEGSFRTRFEGSFTAAILDELKLIRLEAQTRELRTRLELAFCDGEAKRLGRSLDADGIRFTHLVNLIQEVEKAKETVPYPPEITALSNACKNLMILRKALKDESWDDLSLTLGEAERDPLLRCYEEEYRIMKEEYGNSLAVRGLLKALNFGRVEGEVGALVPSQVSAADLQDEIEKATLLQYRAAKTDDLLALAEGMLVIRKAIVRDPIDWEAIGCALNDLKGVREIPRVVELERALVEREMRNVAIQDMLITALRKGGPQGLPGLLDLSRLQWVEVEEVIQIVGDRGINTRQVNELLEIARFIPPLRSGLLDASLEDKREEAYGSIRHLLDGIEELKAGNPQHIGLELIAGELKLISSELQVQEAAEMLERALMSSTDAYDLPASTVNTEKLGLEELLTAIRHVEQLQVDVTAIADLISGAYFVASIRELLILSAFDDLKVRVDEAMATLRSDSLAMTEVLRAHYIAGILGLKGSIRKGRAEGAIGELDCSNVDVEELENAMAYAKLSLFLNEDDQKLLQSADVLIQFRKAQAAGDKVSKKHRFIFKATSSFVYVCISFY